MAYIRPVRNPLRRLPVRMYRGPMRNRLPGLGQLIPEPPVGSSTIGVTEQPAPPSLTDITGIPTIPSPGPTLPAGSNLTNWLNANATTVLWIAGVSIGVLIIARMGR